jgi:hypothetical protein
LREGYRIEKYFVSGEGEYVIPYLMFIPDIPGSGSLIYLHPEGKSADASPGGQVEWFVRKGFTVLVPDLIGTGETGPGYFRGDAFIEGISYNIWFASCTYRKKHYRNKGSRCCETDTPTLRTLMELKKSMPWQKRKCHPVLLHAAAFEPAISRVALLGPALLLPFTRYDTVLQSPFHTRGRTGHA